MNQYLNKCTGEIVRAFQLTKGVIKAIVTTGGSCEAVEGDYMIVRGSNNKEVLKRAFELNFIKIK
jgi:hypothetical protein